MKLSKRTMHVLILCLVFGWASSGLAETKEDRKITNAIEVLNELSAIPEDAIPPSLLNNAYGVAIIPSLLKIGFIAGGRYGKGVLMVRTESNRWSNPSFIYIAGASFGYQIGAQSTDIVLVFKSKKSVDSITTGKITLGADVSVAAGPVGRLAGAGTDILLRSEIYSYSRNRGFFAGICLEGAVLNIDKGANVNFYKKTYITAAEIFDNKDLESPLLASKLRQCLIGYTRQQQQ
ncbi:MAG: lipid-binding SYLF domain-containing protein [Candidatus Magnetomorum sp.]|nr:lipid-binding SYLF domain-containing protein [Candidatus Magnetomorum sp.]